MLDEKTINNNIILSSLYLQDAENSYDSFNRIMWHINLMYFEEVGFKYLNLKRKSIIKIYNETLVDMAIDLRVKKTICPYNDDLEKILQLKGLKRMIEVKKQRQKYSFSDFIKRREAKISKGYLLPVAAA